MPACEAPRARARRPVLSRLRRGRRAAPGPRVPPQARRPRLRAEAPVPALPAGAQSRASDSQGQPERDALEIAAWAQAHELPYHDESVHIPDVRIEDLGPGWARAVRGSRGGHAALPRRSCGRGRPVRLLNLPGHQRAARGPEPRWAARRPRDRSPPRRRDAPMTPEARIEAGGVRRHPAPGAVPDGRAAARRRACAPGRDLAQTAYGHTVNRFFERLVAARTPRRPGVCTTAPACSTCSIAASTRRLASRTVPTADRWRRALRSND